MPSKVFISFTDLQASLQVFFSNIADKSYIFNDFFINLYNTGLRYQELKDFSRWYVNDAQDICIDTLKGGNTRIGIQTDLTDYCIRQFLAGKPIYERLTNSTLCYWIETFLPQRNIYHETKSIKTHLFRHYKAKLMLSQGYTIQQIAYYLGEVDQNNVKNYLYSDLYYWE
jgi:site-specific recombinase XerD